MSNISFGGLATGLDTNSIVDSLVKLERLPEDKLHADADNATQAQTALAAFVSKMSTLKSAAAALADPLQFASVTASSNDNSVVATANGAATPGNYSIDVISLAHEQRTRSSLFTGATTALGQSGTLGITIGAKSVNVSIAAGDDLTTIASKISSSGARVSASVLYDGTKYSLIVRGLDTGAANSVAFSEAGTSLGLSTPANTYQGATDSHIKIDGVIDVTRSSNLVSGAVAGVTFALTKTTSQSATVSVASDPSALTTKIQALVSAYNNVVSSGHFTAGYGSIKASNTLLAGDSSIRMAVDKITRGVTDLVPGTSGAYQTLFSIGVSTDKDGAMSLDTTKLTAALQANPDGVSRLFVKDTTTGSTGAMSALATSIDSMVTGKTSPFVAHMQGYTDRAKSDNERADAMELRILAYQSQLQSRFSALEILVSKYKNQSSTISGIGSTTA